MRARLLLVCALLSGCAITPPEYTKPAVSSEQLKLDDRECERQAEGVSIRSCTQMRLYMRCMTAKGYDRVQNTGSAWRCTLG